MSASTLFAISPMAVCWFPMDVTPLLPSQTLANMTKVTSSRDVEHQGQIPLMGAGVSVPEPRRVGDPSPYTPPWPEASPLTIISMVDWYRPVSPRRSRWHQRARSSGVVMRFPSATLPEMLLIVLLVSVAPSQTYPSTKGDGSPCSRASVGRLELVRPFGASSSVFTNSA